MKRKCIIFGAGKYFESYISIIEEKYQVIAVTDNNSSLVGTDKCGYIIASVNDIKLYEYDTVLICMREPKTVQRQLISMGVTKISLFVEPGLIYSYGESDIANEIREYNTPYKSNDVQEHVLFAQINPCTRTHKFAELLNRNGIKCSLAYFGKMSEQARKALTYYEQVIHFFSYTDFLEYVKNSDYDLIHCSNEPDILISLIGGCGKPVVHDCHDFISLRDNLNAENMALEYVANTKSDGFIYASKMCMEMAIERYHTDRRKAIYLENRPSIDALPKKKLTKLSSIDGKIHCVYEGGLSDDCNHFRFFEEQWKLLASLGIHVHFYTQFKESYCQKIDSLSEFIHYEGNADIYELIQTMTQYDVGLCTFIELPCYKVKLDTTSSNKLFEYLAAGLPIAASDHLFHRNYIEKYGVGRIINWNEDVLEQFNKVSKIEIADDFVKHNRLTMEDQAEALIGLYRKLIK
ncbi:Glycosyl transferases group 1 [Butyrivibrio fibrisolvens DSM 3071]|uniref:Glycosyl transferases group 1 n=1 Tax=Butyrivibrio fibrisolvens DSM 3071 TaxID=1121131 RepID=A0A1M5YYA9_BUTFI|nr:glycosyltransferase [Butyrivibrio fibrisolvens]SHI16965.1 Glycosyl transferases group 1 [Butyrivibrio fibrisolvens DSM 3071]